MRRLESTLPPLLAAISLCCAIVSCDDDNRPAANQAPAVTITSGASDSGTVHYRVEFFWLGTDPDGFVDHYEYAVDDSVWMATENTSQAFLFSADSLAAKSAEGVIVTTDFHRWHSFRVRAVDEHGARSGIEKRTFNAFTIAPVTRITAPDGDEVQLVDSPRFRWSGIDDDGGLPGNSPVAYRYKLVRVEDVSADWATGAVAESLGTLRLDGSVDPGRAGLNRAIPDSVLSDPAVADSLKREWIEVPSNVESIRFLVLSDRGWAFAVRAVDEAGAIEPEYVRNDRSHAGNVHVFHCVGAAPALTVCEPSIGCHTFPIDGPVFDVEVAAGKPLRLGWSVNDDEGDYAFNYGWDIPDPSSESMAPNGEGGWIGWGHWTQMLTARWFPWSDDGVTHYFYFKVRDGEGRVQMGIVRMTVVAFRFDKKMLIIDDFVEFAGMDEEYDRFFDFAPYDSSQVTWINGPGCAPPCIEPPAPPSLSILSRYELLILYHRANYNMEPISVLGNFTSGDDPEGPYHNPKRRTLATYVGAGGKVWVWGVEVAGGLHGDSYRYPKAPYGSAGPVDPETAIFGRASFLYTFLHVRSGLIDVCRRSTDPDALVACSASPAAMSRGYPARLDLDRSRFPDTGAGLAGTEVVRGEPLVEPGLDTLYTHVAKEPGSPFSGEPNALYYRSPTGAHGDVVYFGFDAYYFRADQVRALSGRVLEELLEERP